ncbi:ABC transporter [Halostagnicola larsenii XH-48]|uniref:ABC transporter n=1 Tax=Halostagnicola larsenii XH-48 TaxID=797299 RepID=W0JQD8_9EURY|nr:BMP family protein [Halostagnicola larsenii]AHF99379.1 ABC transporter [Halostagnicola larsenii XH-48]
MRRRTFLTSVGAGATAGLAGCLVNNGDDGSSEADITVGIVYSTGGLGDESFNDMANAGVERAVSEFGIDYEDAEPEEVSDMNEMQRQFARQDDIDLVCCIGYDHQTDLEQNAAEFSDQQFMIVDSMVDADNVINYVFREHEGSFLVGQLAGLLTETEYAHAGGESNPGESIIGFVGGRETSLIKRFEAGYRAGAEHVDEGIDVRDAYAGSFTDPATGQEIANGMYSDGADVVYHSSGNTGGGVFESAQSNGRFAIGVDDDQSVSSEDFSDVIVASMVKYVDNAVYESIQSVVEDDFSGGETNDLGLEEDGVDAVIGQDFEGELPGDITSSIEESRQQIIDGEIDVPTTTDDS